MGMAFYAQMERALMQQRKANALLLANTVSPSMSIEQRAERLASQIKRTSET